MVYTGSLQEVCISDGQLDSMIEFAIDHYIDTEDESLMESFVYGDFTYINESALDLRKNKDARLVLHRANKNAKEFNAKYHTDKHDAEADVDVTSDLYLNNRQFIRGLVAPPSNTKQAFLGGIADGFDAGVTKRKLQNIVNRKYHTPNLIMRQIARLNRWAEKTKASYENAPNDKKGIFAKIKNLIAKAIAKLTSMLQSARNRKKSLIYSDASNEDRSAIDKYGYTGKFSLGKYKG